MLQNIYWSHYLRKTIQEKLSQKPFPILDTWDESHPLLSKYRIEIPGGKTAINLNLIFKDNFNFLNSHEHPEIRVADIVAIILNRFWNRKELKWAKSVVFWLVFCIFIAIYFHNLIYLKQAGFHKENQLISLPKAFFS